MQKIILVLIITLFMNSLFAQEKEIKNISRKYNHLEGVTSVCIPGFVFKLISLFDEGEHVEGQFLRRIKKLRILIVEDNYWNKRLNICDEFMQKASLSDYNQLMSIKENNENVQVLVKYNDKTISNLIIMAGGNENVLIYIKGKFLKEDFQKLVKTEIFNQIYYI